MSEPRKRFAATISGLGIHYDLGEGPPLLGRRMPDLDLVTDNGPLRVFTLLRDARPVLLNLGEPGGFDITDGPIGSSWSTQNMSVRGSSRHLASSLLPFAVLIRPDGYVAWVGDQTDPGLPDALTAWFGPRTAA